MSATIVLPAHAKVNLSLDVLGHRDGYHLVEMVMQTISLHDLVTLELRTDSSIKVVCAHPYVPSGQDNLAWRAAHLLREYGNRKLGAVITISKHIPVSAGLGGGSADAAAVLKGLNSLWNLQLPPEELAKLGLKLGADVPFCLMGGTALARGIGEILTHLPAPPKFWVVLFKPNVGVSTAEVYNSFDKNLVLRRPDTRSLVSAIEAADSQAMAAAMANVLESVTFGRLPLLRRLKQKAMEFGALAAMMSGSGPTVFALTQDYRRAAAILNGLRHQVEFAYITTFKEG